MDIDNFIDGLLADLKANRLKLPTLPQVALKINDIIENPDAQARDVANVVSTDAALAARLIQVANSPLVRGNNPVDNLQGAITRMGMRMVRTVVTTLLLKQLFQTRFPALRERMRQLWSHSSHVAAISHVLAKRFTPLKPEEAMLAGLIHDIGKLPIIAKAETVPDLANDLAALDQITEQLHPALGKAILQAWHFAPALVAVAAEHENVTRDSPTLDYTDVVIVANLHSHVGKKHRLGAVDWNEVPALKKLRLTPENSIATLEEAREEIAAIRELLAS